MDTSKFSDSLGHRADKIGRPPGDISHGEPTGAPPEIELISFDEHNLQERALESTDQALEHVDPDRITWINMEDVRHTNVVEGLGQRFSLHPLTIIEDIVTPGH